MNLPSHLSISELAQRAGVSKATAWRRIRALHDQHGGVLVDVGLKHPRVATARLVELWDFVGAPVALATEVDVIDRRVRRIERHLGIELSF